MKGKILNFLYEVEYRTKFYITRCENTDLRTEACIKPHFTHGVMKSDLSNLYPSLIEKIGFPSFKRNTTHFQGTKLNFCLKFLSIKIGITEFSFLKYVQILPGLALYFLITCIGTE